MIPLAIPALCPPLDISKNSGRRLYFSADRHEFGFRQAMLPQHLFAEILVGQFLHGVPTIVYCRLVRRTLMPALTLTTSNTASAT
ncbi:MAG: hypothetical protein R3F37_20645 [Candidatus Competibacteraceae bacterium]